MEVKEEIKPVVKAPEPKVEKSTDVDEDDDELKLDATAEVDEFSQFLNEFETEVLDDKKKEAEKNGASKPKKERPVTEKKILDGKKLRKKIKPARASPLPRSPLRRRHSPSRRSPGAKYFSDKRRDSSSPGRRRVSSPDVRRKERKSAEKRSSKSKELKQEKTRESSEEHRARERKEYEDKLANLPSPEREVLEARRRKFEGRTTVTEAAKKISLKTSVSAPSLVKKGTETPEFDTGPKAKSAVRKPEVATLSTAKLGGKKQESGGGRKQESPEPAKVSQVTDLRVRLHKKKQEQASKVEGREEQEAKRMVPSTGKM